MALALIATMTMLYAAFSFWTHLHWPRPRESSQPDHIWKEKSHRAWTDSFISASLMSLANCPGTWWRAAIAGLAVFDMLAELRYGSLKP